MKSVKVFVPASKPRNVFARLATARRAGKHRSTDPRQAADRDLVQRLRESGL